MNRVRTISRWLALAMLAVAMWPTAAWALNKPFNSVSFADELHGYIAGGDGTNGVILRTSDGGATPTSWQRTPEAGNYFVGVSSSTGGQATAFSNVGDGIFTTSDYGVTWNPEAPLLNRDVGLSGMAYLAGSRRVVVGKFSAINPKALIASSVSKAPWAVNLEGPLYPPDVNGDRPTTYAYLTAVDAAGATDTVAWAAGNNGTFKTQSQPPFELLVYKTADGGSSWDTGTVAPPDSPGITSVAAVDANRAFIGQQGSAIVLRTVDGGTNWAPITVNPAGWSASAGVNSIDALDADHVVVVGDGGKIAFTSNATAASPSWTLKTPASLNPALLGVDMVDARNWWVVGDNETILHTVDAGATWTGAATVPTPPAASLKPVYRFRNLKNGFYLWSADEAEKNTIVATLYKTWLLEGVAYQINVANPLNKDPLWRFVNIKGGFYLYSSDPVEKAGIQANLAKVWRYEGPAYNVSRASGSPVWRFRNLKNGTYLYSADPAEKNSIVANLAKVWQLEGVAYCIAP